jgi:hypothetical protein
MVLERISRADGVEEIIGRFPLGPGSRDPMSNGDEWVGRFYVAVCAAYADPSHRVELGGFGVCGSARTGFELVASATLITKK